ncbi:MAG: 50S ribosomal protein L13 [Bacteriovoracaceae bacterium]
MYTQRSFTLKPADANKKWLLIDAEGQTVGRLASKVANLLRGKHNPQFTNHTDSGDFVVVVNSEKVEFTGNKWESQKYYRHAGFVGNLKVRTAKEQREIHPELILKEAVKGMLPKNSLGRKQLKKLKIYVGDKHPHEAQNPETVSL